MAVWASPDLGSIGVPNKLSLEVGRFASSRAALPRAPHRVVPAADEPDQPRGTHEAKERVHSNQRSSVGSVRLSGTASMSHAVLTHGNAKYVPYCIRSFVRSFVRSFIF